MELMRQRRQALMKRVVRFTTKYPLIGPIMWILGLQYFVTQVVVAAAWPRSYIWARNLISDLGATQTCGLYEGRYVCSPLSWLMNSSFIIFGITIAIGALLIYTSFERTRVSRTGFIFVFLSGIGAILVGLFPEDVAIIPHYIGAVAGLLVGNIGLLFLATSLKGARAWFRVYTLLTGIVCIAGFILFTIGIDLGIGSGNMERVASYPFTAWMIVLGMYMTFVRLRPKAQQV